MKLSWRPAAEADRLAIYDHIEADNPQAAELVDERTLARILTLLQLPHSGRPGRVEGTRELTVGRAPYFVIWQIEGDTDPAHPAQRAGVVGGPDRRALAFERRPYESSIASDSTPP